MMGIEDWKRYVARIEARECGVKYVGICNTVNVTTSGGVARAGHGSMAKVFLRRADLELVHRYFP